jgi:hypothetical protein
LADAVPHTFLAYKLGCVLYYGSEIVTSNSGQIKKKGGRLRKGNKKSLAINNFLK